MSEAVHIYRTYGRSTGRGQWVKRWCDGKWITRTSLQDSRLTTSALKATCPDCINKEIQRLGEMEKRLAQLLEKDERFARK